MDDPTNWNTDEFNEGLATFKTSAMAREVAKRCNAYHPLIRALRECRDASDDTHIHAMIDEILVPLGIYE